MRQGIYAVYKPVGPTSFDIVAKIRKLAGVRKVGHGGTLDPLAEGVLVVAVGREYTRQLTEIIGHDKEYEASIMLGSTSKTLDREGPIDAVAGRVPPTRDAIVQSLTQFIGEIQQIPPMFSAIKKDGVPLYRHARKGEEIELLPRSVAIHAIDLISYDWPRLKLHVHCGSGVYIRSLARDIGNVHGTGGYLEGLIRTRVGDFRLENCVHLEDYE